MQNNKPLVSIVIPTHNGSSVIERAVDSILKQTYKNVEIIVVDDNGKGTSAQVATQEVVEKYFSLDNFTYICHDVSHHGSAARNTGKRNSKGDFIALLDDDDYFLPNNIEKHIINLLSHDSDYAISYCDMRLIRKEGSSIVSSNYNGDILYDFLCGKIRVGSSLIVVRQEAWDSINGFDESFKRHQDWEFLARLLHKYKICHTNNVGVVKINLDRNIAPDPEAYEVNRIYYLEKMRPIISAFPEEKQMTIYSLHYRQIGLAYIKSYNFIKGFRWLNNSGGLIEGVLYVVHSGIIYFKNRINNLFKR